jgi:hypothetical protein
LDRRLGEPQSFSGCGGEEKNAHPPPRMDITEIRWEVVDWSHLAQVTDQWRALVNTVMNLRVL